MLSNVLLLLYWEFNGEHVLQIPRGITVDNDGNVYVVGYRSNNVVVISPDGQSHRQLLCDKDGLVNPTVLCALQFV
jgi:DNA-binding beta-propeller fold protein YncE